MKTTRSWILPLLAISAPLILITAAARWAPPQDPIAPGLASSNSVAAAESRWKFAVLRYLAVGSDDLHSIEARDITRLWITIRPDGGTMLEVLYENGDFKIAHASEILLVHRTANTSPRDVPVYRRPISGMAFPDLK